MNNQNQTSDFSLFGMNFANIFKGYGCCGGDRDDPTSEGPKQPNPLKNLPLNLGRGKSSTDENLKEETKKMDIKECMIQEESDLKDYIELQQRLSVPLPQIKFGAQFPFEHHPVFSNPLYTGDYNPDQIDFEEPTREAFLSEPPPRVHNEITISSFSKKISKPNRGPRKHYFDLKDDDSSVGSRRRIKRRPWTAQEDAKLLDFVSKHGPSWAVLASLMDGRTGKQIRDRYLNNLRPDIKNGNWSVEEDTLLIHLSYTIGHKWSKIATYLPGRTEGQVKNRFYSHIKKKVLKDDVMKFEHMDLTTLKAKIEQIETNEINSAHEKLKMEAFEPSQYINVKYEENNEQWPQINNGNVTIQNPFLESFNNENMKMEKSTPQQNGNNSQNTSLIPENSSGEFPSESETPQTSLTSDGTYQSYEVPVNSENGYSVSYSGFNPPAAYFNQNPYLQPDSHNVYDRIEYLNKQKNDLELMLARTLKEIEKINPNTLPAAANFNFKAYPN